jgi:hypothetical protein
MTPEEIPPLADTGVKVLRRPKIPPVHSLLNSVREGDTSDQVLDALQLHYRSGGRSEKRLIWLRLRVMNREDLLQVIKSPLKDPGVDRHE